MSTAFFNTAAVIRVFIDADTTGGLDVPVPRHLRLTDLHCIALATVGGGDFTLVRRVVVNGSEIFSPLITGTLACDTLNALTRPTTMLSAGYTFDPNFTASILVTANNAAVRGALVFNFFPIPAVQIIGN